MDIEKEVASIIEKEIPRNRVSENSKTLKEESGEEEPGVWVEPIPDHL